MKRRKSNERICILYYKQQKNQCFISAKNGYKTTGLFIEHQSKSKGRQNFSSRLLNQLVIFITNEIRLQFLSRLFGHPCWVL